jgi:VanZ family protein
MKRWRRFLPVVLYVGLIFLVSSIPSLTAPGPRSLSPDKIAHVVEYSILGALLYGFTGDRLGRSKVMAVMFIIAVGATIGALDEAYQGYVPGRDMSIYDWIADVAGVALGAALMSGRTGTAPQTDESE